MVVNHWNALGFMIVISLNLGQKEGSGIGSLIRLERAKNSKKRDQAWFLNGRWFSEAESE